MLYVKGGAMPGGGQQAGPPFLSHNLLHAIKETVHEDNTINLQNKAKAKNCVSKKRRIKGINALSKPRSLQYISLPARNKAGQTH